MNTNSTPLLAIPVCALLLLSGCASGVLLSTHSQPGLTPNPGTYNLILYGGQNARDFRSIAILDRNDDPYTILPYGAEFNYRIIAGLSADEAMEGGERFIKSLVPYWTTEKREILGPDNSVIGYELRPFFMPFSTGILGDILDTSYLLGPEENRVTVRISLKRYLLNQENDIDGDLFRLNR